jgi:hypothetical protein
LEKIENKNEYQCYDADDAPEVESDDEFDAEFFDVLLTESVEALEVSALLSVLFVADGAPLEAEPPLWT